MNLFNIVEKVQTRETKFGFSSKWHFYHATFYYDMPTQRKFGNVTKYFKRCL